MDLPETAFQALVNNWKTEEATQAASTLTLEQRLLLEQARALRTIRARMDLFTVLIIISMVLTLIFG